MIMLQFLDWMYIFAQVKAMDFIASKSIILEVYNVLV